MQIITKQLEICENIKKPRITKFEKYLNYSLRKVN